MAIQIITYKNSAEIVRLDKTNYLSHRVDMSNYVKFEGQQNVLFPQFYINSTTEPSFNYVHIPEFNRYYFVKTKEWVGNNVWLITLEVDTLFSHKDDIVNLEAFIERNENDFDLSLSDNYTPSKVQLSRNIVELQTKAFTGGTTQWVSSGTLLNQAGYCVVVALNVAAYQLTGDSNWRYPDTPYLYITTSFDGYAELTNVIKRIGADLLSGLTGISDFSGIIADAYVLPYTPNRSSESISKVGLWETQSLDITSWDGIKEFTLPSNCYVLEKTLIGEYFWSADIILPNSEPYKNVTPFTTYSLVKYPLGVVDLDGRILSMLGNQLRLNIGCKCDPLSGQCIFHYGVSEYGVEKTLEQLRNICNIPMGETNVRMDYETVSVKNSNIKITELSTRLVDIGLSAAKSIIKSDFAGAVNADTKVTDLMDFGVPSYSVSGSARSALYTNGAYLIMTYQIQNAIPAELVGRPLYQTRTLSALSGYTKVKDVHMEGLSDSMAEECNIIERYLKEGVILP